MKHPPRPRRRQIGGHRASAVALLVFLHGRGGSDSTFTGDGAVFAGLAKLGRKAPVVAFPDGGEHGYWHDRAEGGWGRYVMREVVPRVEKRFGIGPHRVAIGGISMGASAPTTWH